MEKWLDAGAAISSLLAAIFWFFSACGKIPPLEPCWDKIPDDDPFIKAMTRSMRMNKWAAIFSCFAATCLGAGLLLKHFS